MSALHRCLHCGGGSCAIEHEDTAVLLFCLLCGARRTLSDARREAYARELAEMRGHIRSGPKPRADRGRKRGAVMAKVCKACGVPLRWDTNAQGKPVPINAETGVNHFRDCPEREQFKRPKEMAT